MSGHNLSYGVRKSDDLPDAFSHGLDTAVGKAEAVNDGLGQPVLLCSQNVFLVFRFKHGSGGDDPLCDVVQRRVFGIGAGRRNGPRRRFRALNNLTDVVFYIHSGMK